MRVSEAVSWLSERIDIAPSRNCVTVPIRCMQRRLGSVCVALEAITYLQLPTPILPKRAVALVFDGCGSFVIDHQLWGGKPE